MRPTEALDQHRIRICEIALSHHWRRAHRLEKFSLSGMATFVAGWVEHAAGKLVFNLAVELKDSWAK